jgi:putative ABC transport system substrate-binding protein
VLLILEARPMRRREFITLLGGAATWPIAARAQQPAMPVIGFLAVGTRSDIDLASPGFNQGLREAGFIEGRNVGIEYRWAENQIDRLPALAADLAERRVAVIAASPNAFAVTAARAATATIPIVFYSGPDPVRSGLVASLNRPGGNLTGVTALSADLTPKRLGLLHDLAPGAATVAMLLVERPGGNANAQLEEAQSAGRSVGVRIVGLSAGSLGEFDAAFETAVREGAGALLVSTNVFFINNRDRLVALAAAHKLPAIYQERTFADAGGLMSYGPSPVETYRQLGVYTGRVLKGEKPADLPVLLPTKFDFVINLKTAKALGITVPPGLLASADEVIE